MLDNNILDFVKCDSNVVNLHNRLFYGELYFYTAKDYSSYQVLLFSKLLNYLSEEQNFHCTSETNKIDYLELNL